VLDNAAKTDDRWLRLAYSTGFSIITYADTVGRFKKPFNPLLGETFEMHLDNLKVLGEQVSHHPPITSIHADCEDYTFLGKKFK
jgi:Oxysterol-binding protein